MRISSYLVSEKAMAMCYKKKERKNKKFLKGVELNLHKPLNAACGLSGKNELLTVEKYG